MRPNLTTASWLIAVGLIAVALGAASAGGQPCDPFWANRFEDAALDSPVAALFVWDDDGDGPHFPAMYVGGGFQNVGGVDWADVARWDGNAWTAVGGDLGTTALALAAFDDDGPGPHPMALYAAGQLKALGNIAKWDGQQWSMVGGGTSGTYPTVRALAVFDPDGDGPDLPALYAGGDFSYPAGRIAKWDGSSWSAVGSGFDSVVRALAVFDEDGDGPQPAALYAGGSFLYTGSLRVNGLARWDGSTWSAVGDGVKKATSPGYVKALFAHDEDGPGPLASELYVGGQFTLAGDVSVSNVARWDGTSFSALGSGVDAIVSSFAAFDEDGDGPEPPALYAGGGLTSVNGQQSAYLGRWSDGAWLQVGGAVTQPVRPATQALAAYDDDGPGPHPPALFVGGDFDTVDGIAQPHIAAWVQCVCPADLDGDGDVDTADADALIACAQGPEVLFDDRADCRRANLDGDLDLDSTDFAILQRRLSGSNVDAANCVD